MKRYEFLMDETRRNLQLQRKIQEEREKANRESKRHEKEVEVLKSILRKMKQENKSTKKMNKIQSTQNSKVITKRSIPTVPPLPAFSSWYSRDINNIDMEESLLREKQRKVTEKRIKLMKEAREERRMKVKKMKEEKKANEGKLLIDDSLDEKSSLRARTIMHLTWA